MHERVRNEGLGEARQDVDEPDIASASPRAPERSARGSLRPSAAALASWRPSARLEPVERYARFEILGRIGRGGMAEILLARERSLTGGTRHLVIKRVLPEVREFDEMLHMFLDETRVVMGLSHPNLCQIYDVGEQDGSWFIAMEWVNGVTLHQLIRRAFDGADIDYGVIARVIAECAEALHYAHAARDAEGRAMKLVHRDVSPHNIMIAYDGRVKLLDFGIAKSTATTHQTEAGVVKGKVCYMAPEQWLTNPLDARTDVFALGACLYEALSGRVVFKRDTQLEVMKAAISGDVPKLREIASHVPAALAEIAHRALETRPERRFQTAREMSEALERFVASLPQPSSVARVAAYTRRLFHAELQLGPVLERSMRGAQLAQSAELVLPPLPPSLLGFSRPPPSMLPLPPPPFAFSAPPPRLAAPTASLPPDEGDKAALEPGAFAFGAAGARPRSEPRGLILARLDAPAMNSADAPTSPALPSLRELSLAPRGDEPRPLAKTLSMHVTQRARWAFVAAAVLLAAAIPAASALRAGPGGEKMRVTQLAEAAAPERSRAAAFPAPAFTLLPPGAPLADAPGSPLAHGPRSEQLSDRLSINTRPWSSVYLGKRLLGSTPLANVAVPRGALMLRLVDRDGRVHLRRLPASKERQRTAYFEF